MPPTAEATGEVGGAADGRRLADYDFDLPDDRIALRPVSPRDSARLLTCDADQRLKDRHVHDLPHILRPGDRLVVNNSRVIPAQLFGVRHARGASDDARIGLTLIAQIQADTWDAFAKPAKKLKPGDRIVFAGSDGRQVGAEVLSRDGPEVRVRFGGDPLGLGAPPLPPYIAGKRAADVRDVTDYQTVYADPSGSVAAPTAGLHFTDALLSRLGAGGIAISTVTLHVGAGTFLPVAAEEIGDHVMHAEWGEVSPQTVEEIAATRAGGGRIVAVGTTALRLLESAALSGALQPFRGDTDIFIRPGFRFRVADVLMTNFHLPRSTLLMLVAAFIGYDAMRRVYAHALDGPYRFFSYGDASLLTRRDDP